METFRITMKTGIVHETEAGNEITAMKIIWLTYYKKMDFKKFWKKVEKAEEI